MRMIGTALTIRSWSDHHCGQRLDEVDVERLERIDADGDEDEETGDDGQRDRDER